MKDKIKGGKNLTCPICHKPIDPRQVVVRDGDAPRSIWLCPEHAKAYWKMEATGMHWPTVEAIRQYKEKESGN
ncbi:MAG: hypothetical protein M0R06_01355 [Sphaerochaeta sp.]|nr:hypothetical protein [Sphaerochaeta sp.]